ncbi:MAG: monofunctional biosynthetic peptidoglycan transglycosylase [Rhodospirillaceae bacterium]|nr:monofunctional biosynthetic peptidoglycan transglycosylase [Rhodospirillaceae bacterium]
MAMSYVWRRIGWSALGALLAPAVVILFFAAVPVPLTPLMLIRAWDGAGIARDWVALTEMSPRLTASVIAAEDNLFCRHAGFDVAAIRKAWDRNQRGGTLRGASTISQQTAKNLFLWPGRSFVRKGLEAWLTVYVEALWTKRRTMEVYLNIVEWGPGVYGAEAAARHHFGKSAAALSAREAALLAAVLPNPRKWSAGQPGPYVRGRAEQLRGRASGLGDLLDCVT